MVYLLSRLIIYNFKKINYYEMNDIKTPPITGGDILKNRGYGN
nr:MAG TPA: hypothetical protein [Caudoviricetes sp.]